MRHKIPAILFAAMLLLGLSGVPAQASRTEHCPDKDHPSKVETGERNSVVLPQGTVFCVKGSTDATGKLTADGVTNLKTYLGNGHDVSYYIVYSVPETTDPAPETTVPQPEVTVPEVKDPEPEVIEAPAPPRRTTAVAPEPACVPTGNVITDVETGNQYFYDIPTLVGFDTCGNPIPNICVEWRPGEFSRLWVPQDCTPEAPTVLAADASVPPTQSLPETGSETTFIAIIAGILLLSGVGLLWIRRHGNINL